MANIPKSELEKGVICSSAGNHAQGVALGAKKLVNYRFECSSSYVAPVEPRVSP